MAMLTTQGDSYTILMLVKPRVQRWPVLVGGRPPRFRTSNCRGERHPDIGMAKQSELKKPKAIPTAGQIFPDGAALDIIRDSSSPENLRLLSWRGKILDEGPQISIGGRRYEPVRVNRSVMTALRFPARVAPPESAKELFTDVQRLLRLYLGQLDSCITAMVFAIFAAWLAPVLPMAPILSIYAPVGSPKYLTMQLLSLLCPRVLCLAGVKRSDLLGMPMELRPTLLLAEPDLQPAMRNILHAAAHRGFYVPSGDGVRELYGPKIIMTSKSPNTEFLEAEVLQIALIPVSGQRPSLDKKTAEQVAEEFQARFLGYFLQNFSGAQVPTFDVSDLAVPVQDLARAFGAVIIGDTELQARILPLLKVLDEEICADRARACDAVVLEALLFFIHEGGWSKVRTESVAEKVCAIYKGRGSDQQPSPESVGRAIRRLGIPSGRINRSGNGVELNVSTCRLIHNLARSHCVRAMEGGLRKECRYCEELEPMIAPATT